MTSTAGLTVLLVDDDPNSVRALTRMLTGAGHTVIGCDDADAALEEVRTRMIDVVVTDLHIGIASGDDLVRAILAHSPDTRTIILTGSEVGSGDLSALLVVQKPVRGSQLLRVIAVTELPFDLGFASDRMKITHLAGAGSES